MAETYVSAGRTRLSALTPEALGQMGAWLPGALAPEWTRADLDAALGKSTGVLITDAGGAAIGLAVVMEGVPAANCATIPLLAIEPSRRFRGLGGEAGVALSRQLRSHGFEKIYVPVPDWRGLAVYFWLRLGFRPLGLSEAPGPVMGLNGEPRAGIWMVRQLSED